MGDVSLELLQAIVQRVMDVQSTMTLEFEDLKSHMTSLEHAMISVRGELVLAGEASDNVPSQVAHLDARLRRVERRPELIDAPA